MWLELSGLWSLEDPGLKSLQNSEDHQNVIICSCHKGDNCNDSILYNIILALVQTFSHSHQKFWLFWTFYIKQCLSQNIKYCKFQYFIFCLHCSFLELLKNEIAWKKTFADPNCSHLMCLPPRLLDCSSPLWFMPLLEQLKGEHDIPMWWSCCVPQEHGK